MRVLRNINAMDTPLTDLLDSWLLHLRMQRKSPNTISAYRAAVFDYIAWCREHHLPEKLDRRCVTGYAADRLDEGRSVNTVRLRHSVLCLLAAWLAAEGEIPGNPLAGLRGPSAHVPVVPELTQDQLAALIAACSGQGFAARRDAAMIRLMAETGLRAREAIDLAVTDVVLDERLVTVRQGKGGAPRVVGIGDRTTAALDAYLRARRRHPLAEQTHLWLGANGTGFGYHGMYHCLRNRAKAAGISPFWPHMLRHTFAGRWLDAGGSENALMEIAGWRTRVMIDRYSKHSAAKRAVAEAKRLNLGDI